MPGPFSYGLEEEKKVAVASHTGDRALDSAIIRDMAKRPFGLLKGQIRMAPDFDPTSDFDRILAKAGSDVRIPGDELPEGWLEGVLGHESPPPVSANTDIMGGRLVFDGTRVPVDVLFGNLADGLTVDEIVDAYPTLKKEDVLAVLRAACHALKAAHKGR